MKNGYCESDIIKIINLFDIFGNNVFEKFSKFF